MGVETTSMGLLFGKAFLVAVAHHDRDHMMLFARAMLTQFPPIGPQW